MFGSPFRPLVEIAPRARGFSLLELMVTVAITAILATVSLSMFQYHMKRSRMAETYSVLESMRLSQKMYKDSNGLGNGSYAANIQALGWCMDSGQTCNKGRKPAEWVFETDGVTCTATATDPTAVYYNPVILQLTSGDVILVPIW